jgi:hypothetical protein
MGFLKDIDDAFRCDNVSFYEGLIARIIGRRKQVSPLKGQTEGKGSARMGNTQCSMALYQAN